MMHGKRGPRSSDPRRYEVFYPRGERLESRLLLALTAPAVVDLVGQAPPGLPQIAINTVIGSTTVSPTTPPPYGVLEAGRNPGGGAGFSVSDLGDVNSDGFDDFLVGLDQFGQKIQPLMKTRVHVRQPA